MRPWSFKYSVPRTKVNWVIVHPIGTKFSLSPRNSGPFYYPKFMTSFAPCGTIGLRKYNWQWRHFRGGTVGPNYPKIPVSQNTDEESSGLCKDLDFSKIWILEEFFRVWSLSINWCSDFGFAKFKVRIRFLGSNQH